MTNRLTIDPRLWDEEPSNEKMRPEAHKVPKMRRPIRKGEEKTARMRASEKKMRA